MAKKYKCFAIVEVEGDDVEVLHLFNEPNKPAFNGHFKNADTGETAQCMTLFTSRFLESFNVKFEMEDKTIKTGNGEIRLMPVAAAAIARNQKQGYINAYPAVRLKDK